LNALENGTAQWRADPPGALTPGLSLADGAESTLSSTVVVATIRRFLENLAIGVGSTCHELIRAALVRSQLRKAVFAR